MYNPLQKLLRTGNLLLIASSIMLTACGGASSDGATDTPPAKPGNPSSVAESSPASSSTPVLSSSSSSVSSKVASSGNTTTSVNNVASSSSYARASRSNTSTTVSSTGGLSGTDTSPPNATSLLAYKIAETNITLMWEDARDNIGIKNYIIRRDGVEIASIDAFDNRFTDENLTASTDYSYTITAIDLAENTSPESKPLSVSTLGKPGAVTSSSNKSASSSSKASSTSNKSASSSSSKSVGSQNSLSSSSSSANPQTVKIVWTHPKTRENGEFLSLDEISGYEIRYRKPDDKYFTYFSISGNRTTEFSYTSDFTSAEFEIAVVDSDGRYSRFVSVSN